MFQHASSMFLIGAKVHIFLSLYPMDVKKIAFFI